MTVKLVPVGYYKLYCASFSLLACSLESYMGPARCFLGAAWPVFWLKFSGTVHFRPVKVKARPGPATTARPVNEMNAHYRQFVSCFLENLFLAETLKQEITAVAISLYFISHFSLYFRSVFFIFVLFRPTLADDQSWSLSITVLSICTVGLQQKTL